MEELMIYISAFPADGFTATPYEELTSYSEV